MKKLEIIYSKETLKKINDNLHYHGSKYLDLDYLEYCILDYDLFRKNK